MPAIPRRSMRRGPSSELVEPPRGRGAVEAEHVLGAEAEAARACSISRRRSFSSRMFTAYPLIQMFWMSFHNWSIIEPENGSASPIS